MGIAVYDVEVNTRDSTWDGFIGVLFEGKYYNFEDVSTFSAFVQAHKILYLVGYNNASYDNYIINKVSTGSTFKEANDWFFKYVGDAYKDDDGVTNINYIPRYQPLKCLNTYHYYLVDVFTILNPSTFRSLKEYALLMDYHYAKSLNTYETMDEMYAYNQDDLIVTKMLYDQNIRAINTVEKIRKMYNITGWLTNFLHPATQIRWYAKAELSLNPKFNIKNVVGKIKDNTVRNILHQLYIDPPKTLTTAEAREKYGTKKAYEEFITSTRRIERGGVTLEFGKGGVHDKLKNYVQKSPIVNIDFASFYPHLYMSLGVFNEEKSLRTMLQTRLNNKTSEEGVAYKLILNTLYGVLKSIDTENLRCYDGVTIAGQTIILELVDFILKCDPNAHIVDVNTDGVMVATDKNIPLDFVSESFGFIIPYEVTPVCNLIKKDTNNYVFDGKVKGAWLDSERTLNTYNIRNIYDVLFNGADVCPQSVVKYKRDSDEFKTVEIRYLTDEAIAMCLEMMSRGDYINASYATFMKKDLLMRMLDTNALSIHPPAKISSLTMFSEAIRRDFKTRF